MASITLHQFRYSHFNDKVRWALAFKGIAHARDTYLPGPHLPALRRLSGQSQTPVLVLDGVVIAGSAAIIDALEQRYPDPPLYPAGADDRRAALAWQQRLDDELGPATRTVLFSVLIDEADYLCRMFAAGKPRLKRLAYRATFPLARPLMARGNGINPGNIARSEATTAAFLDDIAARTSAGGYLAGGAFSVADLTAAALIAPLCHPDPECIDMRRPTPMPAAVERLLSAYAGHPAIAWTQRMYREHRR